MILATVFTLAALAGCSDGNKSNTDTDPGSETDPSPSMAAGDGSDSFFYSDSIGQDGYFETIVPADYVSLCDYSGIEVPGDIHQISDAAVQEQIDSLLAAYAGEEKITDRAVKDADTVNIDYVGSINGEEFDGGNTQGAGTNVTVGVTQYIDDFLEQLIGHTPGETFDVNVTFPDDYGKDELNGKDAVFEVTINYISQSTLPELTDSFVSENLSADYGWSTVALMKQGIKTDLTNSAISNFLQQYVVDNSSVSSLPEALMGYQENSMIAYFQGLADNNGVTIETVIASNFGYSTIEEMLQASKTDNTKAAELSLIVQAIGADASISVSEEDIAAYFGEYVGSDDYSQYEEYFGMPYLKYIVLNQKVLDLLKENAVLL